jgi:hypothetical protein
MNKQFDKLLEGCPGCPLYLSDSEQQVWLAAQKTMLEVGYRKPQEQGMVRLPSESRLTDMVAKSIVYGADGTVSEIPTTYNLLKWLLGEKP